ncbi:MAG: PhoPQ-activated pathogenicity-related family protein [Sedimentisphaerales bacterium]
MKPYTKFAIFVVLIFPIASFVLATPLDDYVARPDANYRYSLENTIKGDDYTAYVLEMISQSWRNKIEVDRTIWQHWLTIIKPDEVTSNKALLWITGGSNDRPAPTSVESMLANIAIHTKTVVSELRMVPNQPLVFPDGGGPRYEDAIIAYTFDKFWWVGDANWPLLLPMVKSAVRAMDTIQDCMISVSRGQLKIDKFVVSGASKRGWTTWLTAAVDPRVIAIAPVVIDVLNMDEQMKHHYSAYGFYSDAIHDYEDLRIFERLGTAEGAALIKFVDPYEYRHRYTMPKFMINGAGDQFFLPDAAQFYFHDLPGEKYLRYVPNADHSLDGSDADKSLLIFYNSILTGAPRPKFSWRVRKNSIIVKHRKGTLRQVNLWQATNPKARDFRLETIGKAWKRTPLTPEKPGVYVARVQEPAKGWTAFFVEMIYDSGLPIPYKFTTQVHVVPDTLPFAQ